ncbi:hypothetical protein INS49_003597 [Diaporthe citri]|uniref:uncharacterized protein n=1 Tax=Diaporthe citri TaxID=83186 RepID=UPI001C8094FF|nr:uncharacterized protein INS49_003597 [Diaporthe citri]KAG6355635.1 hypothetical protein INS49_003597 [Diaporthe citri]
MTKLSATWTQLTQSARLQRSSQCLSVLGSNIFILGGELVPRQPVDNRLDVISLGASKAEVSTLDAPPEALTPCGGIAMAPVEEDGAVWRYTPSQPSWELLKPADPERPFPARRSYHAMASDGLGSRAWSELAAAPEPARGGTSIAYSGGKLYRMNGFDGTTEQGGLVDTYDLATNEWSSFAFKSDGKSGPGPRSVSTLVAVTVKGKTYLVTMFGECDPSSLGHAGAGKMLSDVWAFDVDGQDWF